MAQIMQSHLVKKINKSFNIKINITLTGFKINCIDSMVEVSDTLNENQKFLSSHKFNTSKHYNDTA